MAKIKTRKSKKAKSITPKSTKGKLSAVAASSTEGTPPPAPVPSAPPVTSYSIFERSLVRAQNLLKAAKGGKLAREETDDAMRSSIVLAVAALDAFVRTYVVEIITKKIADLKQSVPTKLKDQAKSLMQHDELFDCARQGDIGSKLADKFREHFEERSFQGVKNIDDAMKLIGYEDIFHFIALEASVNEDHLKRDVGRFTKRRHIIAHCGDYDLNQNPAKENEILEADVNKCIEVIKLMGDHIKRLKT